MHRGKTMHSILLKAKSLFTPSPKVQSEKKTRHLFIDLYRGWAIIIMIETHIVNEMLVTSFQKNSWSFLLNYMNGMVAPSFLFISGFSFFLAISKKPAILKTLKKILFVWIIGYALHLPYYSFKKIFWELSYDRYLSFIQVDVLHCIAAGWLIMLIASLIIRSSKGYFIFLWIAAIGIVTLAPFIWKTDFGKFVPIPVAAYFNKQYNSLFPLFPWVAFMLFGGIIAHIFTKVIKKEKEKPFIRNLFIIGIILVALFFIVFHVFSRYIRIPMDWTIKPDFFTLRLGSVFLLFCILWYYEQKRSIKSKILLYSSREALTIYVWHLLFLFSFNFAGKTLSQTFYKSLVLWQCAIASIALIILMFAIALLWSLLKNRFYPLSRLLFYGFWIFFLSFMTISPK